MIKQYTQQLLVATALFSLTACTNMVSKGINDEGVPEQVIFPEVKQAWLPTGIFPNADNVRNIAPGVTKDDLYYLIGRPHFSEMKGAREWDYIFKFRHGKGNVNTCQYKVIFDKEMLGQSFYWKPKACAKRFHQTVAALSTDTLFPYNRGRIADISPAGKKHLRQLAKTMRQKHHSAKVQVIGYTDYLGSNAYNQRLSQQRANSVKRFLVKQGVNAKYLSAMGKGESNPVVTCNDEGSRQALIQCLAPNRRVTVDVMPH